uniref:Uncharacterized protein n=1 Tax=Rhizophora mucronata TaxID=61149 RepID=A0A2P2MW04_RHIMU
MSKKLDSIALLRPPSWHHGKPASTAMHNVEMQILTAYLFIFLILS